MINKLFSLILLIFLVSAKAPVFAFDGNVYVSPYGSDQNDGTINSPVLTLQSAQEKVRTLIASGYSSDITVYLRGGEYPIVQTLKFGRRDCREDITVTYRSYPNETAVLNGGVTIPGENITKTTDQNILNRINASAAENIYQADISFIETVYNEGQDFTANLYELCRDGELLNVAKYPNSGYLYTGDILRKGEVGSSGSKWTCGDSEILNMIGGEDSLYVAGNITYEWHWQQQKVNAVDPNAKTVETVEPFNYNNEAMAWKNRPYYFLNSPALIDIENEYYFDPIDKTFYFYSKNNPEESRFEVSVLNQDMISLSNAQNIVFQDITFMNARRSAISSEFNSNLGCRNIRLEGCTVKNFGGNAINFWYSKDCVITGCEIYNIGSVAINSQGGNIELMESSGFEMTNNIVHKTGRLNPNYAAGLWMHGFAGGTGGYVAHNEFYDMPFMALTVKFESIVEYNDIHDVCLASADMGAIYMGGPYHDRGIVIRYNYIHDIPCNFAFSGYGTNGIYLDGGFGFDVYGNVVKNVSRNFYYSSSGGDKKVHDNIFIGNEKSSMIARQPDSSQTIRVAEYSYNRSSESVMAEIPEYTYTSPLWLSKYPEIKEGLDSGSPYLPSHQIYRNIIYRGLPFSIAASAHQSEFTNITYSWNSRINPGFVNMREGNYGLKFDAEALLALPGFAEIDFNKIGTLNKK